MQPAMRVRSPGPPVTTGAWWRTAVVMTMVSTTPAARDAAQARPAARRRAGVRECVAAFEHAGDLVLGSAAPGPGQDDDDGDDGADARGGELVVQGEEVGVTAFGGEQRAGVVDDGAHFSLRPARARRPAGRLRSATRRPADGCHGAVLLFSYSATISRARDVAAEALRRPRFVLAEAKCRHR